MHQFETGAAAQYHDAIGERQFSRHQAHAHELVEGVMAADVLRHVQQASRKIEQRGRVNPARIAEFRLRRPHAGGQAQQQRHRKPLSGVRNARGRGAGDGGIEPRGAAHAAAGPS